MDCSIVCAATKNILDLNLLSKISTAVTVYHVLIVSKAFLEIVVVVPKLIAQMDIFKGFIDFCTFFFQSQPELFMTLQPDVSADYFVYNPDAIAQGGIHFNSFFFIF